MKAAALAVATALCPPLGLALTPNRRAWEFTVVCGLYFAEGFFAVYFSQYITYTWWTALVLLALHFLFAALVRSMQRVHAFREHPGKGNRVVRAQLTRQLYWSILASALGFGPVGVALMSCYRGKHSHVAQKVLMVGTYTIFWSAFIYYNYIRPAVQLTKSLSRLAEVTGVRANLNEAREFIGHLITYYAIIGNLKLLFPIACALIFLEWKGEVQYLFDEACDLKNVESGI